MPSTRREGSARVPSRARRRSRSVPGSEARWPGVDGEELLDEERVAVRPSRDRLDERFGSIVPDRANERAHPPAVETVEVHARRAPAALQLGEDGDERVSPVQLVGPERRHDRRPAAPEPAREVGQELEARPVGPVNVLEHEDQAPGRSIEQFADRLVHATTAHGVRRRMARRGIRQQRRQHRGRRAEHLAGAVAQCLDEPAEPVDERRVRQDVGAQLDAGANRRHGAGRRARHQLRHETALADARLSANQDHRARASVGDGCLESMQVFIAADEDGAGATHAHAEPILAAADGRGRVVSHLADRRFGGRRARD